MTCPLYTTCVSISHVSGFPPQSATRIKELQLGILDEAWPLYATTTIDLMDKIPYLNFVLKSVGVREMASWEGLMRSCQEPLDSFLPLLQY